MDSNSAWDFLFKVVLIGGTHELHIMNEISWEFYPFELVSTTLTINYCYEDDDALIFCCF